MKADRKFSLIFYTTLLIGVVIFGFIGATYAYFTVEKIVGGQFGIGFIDIGWYNDGTFVESDSVYNQIWLEGKLVRGDEAGQYIVKSDGTRGTLTLMASTNSESMYVRIKPYAYVWVDTDGDMEPDAAEESSKVDVTQYLSFSFVDSDGDRTYLEDDWGTAGDTWVDINGDEMVDAYTGWYYYIDYGTNIFTVKNSASINNVALSGSFPTIYMTYNMCITFEYDAIQSANIGITEMQSQWGDWASLILYGEEAYIEAFGQEAYDNLTA